MKMERRISHVGWDSHKEFSVATTRDEQNRLVGRWRLEHSDRASMRECLKKWPAGTPVVLEGTFGWGWISDELRAAGLDPHLASSRKVAAWREARGLPKSNRIDADLLSELWLQQPRWWEVWLAPPEVRDQREWLRYRMSLVHLQTGLKNRIHAILHRHGVMEACSDLFGTQGRQLLRGLVCKEDRTLPESGRATLQGYLQLLDHIRRQIARVTREVRKQLVRTPAGCRLKTLPGIGEILAYTILAEVGRIERFASAKHLASYSVLAPRSDDSGEETDGPPIGRHVGHAGRRTLKWAWIEAAHGAVRRGGRFRELFDRRTNGGKRDRNRGYIAVAHQLCRIAHVLLKKEVDYIEEPPPRPGSGKRSRISRPGMGQPDHPMVVAAV